MLLILYISPAPLVMITGILSFASALTRDILSLNSFCWRGCDSGERRFKHTTLISRRSLCLVENAITGDLFLSYIHEGKQHSFGRKELTGLNCLYR